MGGGSYSSDSRLKRAVDLGYSSRDVAIKSGYATESYIPKSRAEIFKERSINDAMNPYGLKVRESRDSMEHPNSVAIIIALDVTGSMGSVPHYLVQEGLPHIMDKIIQSGIKDPQVLFLAIGDHTCDRSPLQVGQFESSDELLDKWLTDVYLEGNGGGNDGESYHLAWYLAARHTSIDCFEKRGKKGLLFTIGDEPVLKEIGRESLKDLMGDGQYSNITAMELLDEARKNYNVFHVHVRETNSGQRRDRIEHWSQIMHDHLRVAERHEDIAGIISDEVVKHFGEAEQKNTQPVREEKKENDTTSEEML